LPFLTRDRKARISALNAQSQSSRCLPEKLALAIDWRRTAAISSFDSSSCGVLDTDPVAVGLKKQLDDLEESAPVVPEWIYDRVEREWKQKGAHFVGKAAELYH